MPLKRYIAAEVPPNTPTILPYDLTTGQAAKTPENALKIEAKPAHTGRKVASSDAMSKEDYWRRREERDIETGVRIRRSGIWQAALQSVVLGQYAPTLEDYWKLLEQAAEKGLTFVNKQD